LNTHYVKKRNTNELDNNYSGLECNNDNTEPSLVEIGEVREKFILKFEYIFK